MAESAMLGLGAGWLLALRCLSPYPGVLVRAWARSQEMKCRRDLCQGIVPLLHHGGLITWSDTGAQSLSVHVWPKISSAEGTGELAQARRTSRS
jgi:hypothetical protein